jgi:hypothetical protein
LPEYFLIPLASLPLSATQTTPPVYDNIGSDPNLPRGYAPNYNQTPYPFYPGLRSSLHMGQTSSWFFGESLRPSSASLLFARPAAAGSSVRFGKLGADGSTRWGPLVSVGAGSERVTGRLPGGNAVGLSVQALGTVPAHSAAVEVGSHAYELDGALSTAVVPGPWRLAGLSQGYAVFTFSKPPVPISATTTSGRPLRVQVISSTTKSEEVRVVAPGPASIVRSVAWDSGWTGTVSVDGGAARNVPVDSFDLVQRVRIPAGDDVVTFRYKPPHLVVASALTLGAVALLLVLLGGWFVVRRRRRLVPPVGASEPQREEQPVSV